MKTLFIYGEFEPHSPEADQKAQVINTANTLQMMGLGGEDTVVLTGTERRIAEVAFGIANILKSEIVLNCKLDNGYVPTQGVEDYMRDLVKAKGRDLCPWGNCDLVVVANQDVVRYAAFDDEHQASAIPQGQIYQALANPENRYT